MCLSDRASRADSRRRSRRDSCFLKACHGRGDLSCTLCLRMSCCWGPMRCLLPPTIAILWRDDAKAAKAGEYEFRINCALCHGLGAHGGGRGPDLTRALRKAHVTLRCGNVSGDQQRNPGTAMPSNGTNGQGVGMTDEEIWQIITYIRSVEVKAPARPMGNAAHGKDCFTEMRIARCATWSTAKADGLGRN
jgi:mono/diheme cytochrome c family protein